MGLVFLTAITILCFSLHFHSFSTEFFVASFLLFFEFPIKSSIKFKTLWNCFNGLRWLITKTWCFHLLFFCGCCQFQILLYVSLNFAQWCFPLNCNKYIFSSTHFIVGKNFLILFYVMMAVRISDIATFTLKF